MNLLSANKHDTPDKKHKFFILEIGREKESYPYCFYNEAGVDLYTFIEHLKKTAQKAAEILVKKYTKTLNSNCGIVDDFTIHFNAVEHMVDFGYKKFEPQFIVLEDNPYNFNFDSPTIRSKGNLEIEIAAKEDFGVFMFSAWDGSYHDSIRNKFFNSANSYTLAHSIVLDEFNKTSDKINECKLKNENNENTELIEKELASIVKQFFDTVNEMLNKNGFKEVHSHNSFLYCNYKFTKKLIPVIGEDNYRKLVAFNEEIHILQKNSINNKPKIESKNSNIDLPF